MSRRVFEIFLSSTARGLAPHRAKVREMVERLHQASICMETFGAKPTRPLATCREEVLKADALVVIVGHRYGWIPTAEEGGDNEKSITWWEVHWAFDGGKPVYAYLIDEKAPWNGEREQDRLVPAKSQKEADEVWRAVRNLQDFRTFLDANTTRELFTSADDLGGKVATSLANWLQDERLKIAAKNDDDSRGTEPQPGASPPPAWSGSPFPGLRAFTPADAPIFFGRRRETDFLVAKLCDSSAR